MKTKGIMFFLRRIKVFLQRLRLFVVARPTEAMKKAKKCLNTSAFKARIGFYRLEQWSALMFQQCQNWFVFYGPMVRIGFIVSLRQHSSTLYF